MGGNGWLVAGLVAAYLLVMVYASYYIGSGFYVRAICSFATTENEIALTFDDGPDNVQTPVILDLLKEAGFQASFFCIGKKIDENSIIVKRMIDEGHLIGNHSFNHSHNFPMLSSAKIRAELMRTNEVIERHTGTKNYWFRPPFGVTNPMIYRGLKGMNLKVAGWNIRSLDTTNRNKEAVLERITSRLKKGDIVLLHDTSANVIWVLKELIEYMKQNGYKSVALPL
jgi:peptidoglycan/xylan/chitin deacetylase (PgdA/CDA1 family)